MCSSDLIVIDDLPAALLWAEELGAKCIQAHLLSDLPPPFVSETIPTMTHWSQLPDLLKALVY